MSAPYLEIKGLKKTYSLKPILRGIDCVLDQGERMVLLGANGAGKTTLLRILACLTKPGAGTVRIGGLDIVRARRAGERVGTLSRGQIQRLSLARALLHSPRLLLLDEPDAGLDDEGIELLEELLREHAERGGTTLFTTHNFERAVKFSDKICMLGGGRVVYQQATSGLEPVGVRQAYQEALR